MTTRQISITQEDINNGQNTDADRSRCETCPGALAFSREFGEPWNMGVSHAFPNNRTGMRADTDEDFTQWILAADRALNEDDPTEGLSPATFTVEIVTW